MCLKSLFPKQDLCFLSTEWFLQSDLHVIIDDLHEFEDNTLSCSAKKTPQKKFISRIGLPAFGCISRWVCCFNGHGAWRRRARNCIPQICYGNDWPSIPKDVQGMHNISYFKYLLECQCLVLWNFLGVGTSTVCNYLFLLYKLRLEIYQTNRCIWWLKGKLIQSTQLLLAARHYPTSIDTVYLRTLALGSASAAISSQRSFFAIPECHKYLGTRG